MSMTGHEEKDRQAIDLLGEGAEVVARGARGYVIRDTAHPGYCIKVPHDYDQGIASSQAEDVAAHDVLVALGVPTIPEYRLRALTITSNGTVTETMGAEMTDLSDGGQNLVVSAPDVLQVGRVMNPEVWFALGRGRPVYNGAAFFDELEAMVRTMAAARGEIAGHQVDTVRICASSGLFLIARPDGTISTVVGDYEDGVSLQGRNDRYGDPGRWEFYMPVEAYLTMVIHFFPDLKPQAADLLNRLTGGTYPLDLLGEVNDFRRGDIARRHRI